MNIQKIKLRDLGKVDYQFGISIQKKIHDEFVNEAKILFFGVPENSTNIDTQKLPKRYQK